MPHHFSLYFKKYFLAKHFYMNLCLSEEHMLSYKTVLDNVL